MEWTWGWGAVIVAAIAAAIAVWQALEARRSRLDAQQAQGSAESAAQAAAGAQQQTADALAAIAELVRQQHEDARAAASKKPDPWRVEPVHKPTGDAVMLRLDGDDPVHDVSMTFERAPGVLMLDPNPVPSTMHPGDAVEIYWLRTYDDRGSGTFVLEVRWRREGDAELAVSRTTLS
ncbi:MULTISPECIES: hypothetical protein [unclassified Microbacterium]|uniref:hypothetical protein n=1 Tax=unclassified Microbacterium TaxID=2609290 RepID=UPI003655919B